MYGNTSIPNNTIGALCTGQVYTRMAKCQSIQLSVLRFLTVVLTLAKIAINYKELMKNKLFALYFFFLLSGGIVSVCSIVYFGAYSNYYGPCTVDIGDTSSSIEIVGLILIDTFFGLVPNLFYSLYKTKLTKETEQITRKYFYANGIVIACIIVVLLITEFAGPNPVISSSVIILETIYSVFFYLFVIVVMRNEEGRVEKILWRYFYYYCFYAVTIFVRNAVEITVTNTQPYTQVWWANYPTDTILAGVTLAVVSMFLRDIKLSTNHKRQSKNSKRSVT